MMRHFKQLDLFGPEAAQHARKSSGAAKLKARGSAACPKASAPVGARPVKATYDFSRSAGEDEKFRLVPIGDVALGPETTDLISGLLPSSGLAVVYGRSGSGKSFAALDVALHVATGRMWAGRKVSQAGVIYVAAEGASGFLRRAIAARNHLDARDAPLAITTGVPNLGGEPGDADRLRDTIRTNVKKQGWSPGLIVIDTLARTMAGYDENSSRDMGSFVENVERIGREFGCLVLVVHHAGKYQGSEMRGSSALRAAADTVWSVRQEGEARVITLEKSRDAPDNLRWSFKLDEVVIAANGASEPIRTCIVNEVTEPTPAGVLRHNRAEARNVTSAISEPRKLLFDVIEATLVEKGEHIPRGDFDDQRMRGVRKFDARDEYVRRHRANNIDSRRKAFDRYLRAACDCNILELVEVAGIDYIVRCR